MAAAALALSRLTAQERERQMREFFARMPESERQRWIALIEMQAAQAAEPAGAS